MKKIIGLSGAHGTGKSTIAKDLAESGQRVDHTQLSRTAQAQLGWDTVDRVKDDIASALTLQEMICDAMKSRDESLMKQTPDSEFTVVERSPADVWAYTQLWCKYHNVDKFFNPIAIRIRAKCMEMLKNYAGIIEVPINDSIPFVKEANRAGEDTRLLHSIYVTEFIMMNHVPTTVITDSTRIDRLTEARLFIKLLKENIYGR